LTTACERRGPKKRKKKEIKRKRRDAGKRWGYWGGAGMPVERGFHRGKGTKVGRQKKKKGTGGSLGTGEGIAK